MKRVDDAAALIPSAKKDLSLEAVRGAASIIVFVWHFFIAFDPTFLFDPARGLVGLPIYGLFHGTAAVDVFFLLSGYVLTKRFFETGDNRLLIVGAAKRWFRLMPLVLFSVLLSWLLYHFGLYAYEKAAMISKSPWLFMSGGSQGPPVHESFWSALWQGTVGTFLFNETSFNTNLWTIRIEFFGSLMAFAFAALVYRFKTKHLVVASVSLVACIVIAFVNLHYLSFVAGPLLALYARRYQKLSWQVGISLLIMGFALLGYRAPIGFYGFMDVVAPHFLRDDLYIVLSSLGASMIIIACTGWMALHKRMQTPFSKWLGRISFPLYLIHVVLICSLGAGVFTSFTQTTAQYASGLFITALILVPTTLALATFLGAFDAWWVRKIGLFAAKAFYATPLKSKS